MRNESEVNLPIPEIFYNSDTGKPFEECLMCKKYLLNPGSPYIIEKAVRNYPEYQSTQVIFEYAICVECAMVMHTAMSKESRKRMNEYFFRNVNYARRNRLKIHNDRSNIQPWLNNCLVKDTSLAECEEYQLVAHCSGNQLHSGEMPFGLSMQAIDEITGLLSPKSLGEMDDWIGNFFTGPPDVAELLRQRKPVII